MIDPLVVGLIRSLNANTPEVRRGLTDEELVGIFGQAAQPLADALREAICHEVRRALA
jgi:hypothetical protein